MLGGSVPLVAAAQVSSTPVRVDSLDIGAFTIGDNRLSIQFVNLDTIALNMELSVQAQGLRGWGRTWYRQVASGQPATMTAEYQVPDRSYRILSVSLGVGPRIPSAQDPYPEFRQVWRRRFYIPVPSWAPNPEPWVAPPSLRERVRALGGQSSTDASAKDRLRALLGWNRKSSIAFSPQVIRDDTIGTFTSTTMRIGGEPGAQPIEFAIVRAAEPAGPLPAVLYLVGNPPGLKSAGLVPSIAFAQAGFLAVTMDRRPSARATESGEFLANLADPVFDARRVVDYLLTRSDVDRHGIAVVGFSRGAYEAQFLAALHDSVKAAVLVAGVTTQEQLFQSVAWLPTLFDPDVLRDIGHPELVGQSYDVWANTLTGRDHGAALAAYRARYPFFDELDATRVLPLAAPTPLLVITGALDRQFELAGVLRLDSVVSERFAHLGVEDASALMIQPRTGHGYSVEALDTTVAFLRYWLAATPVR